MWAHRCAGVKDRDPQVGSTPAQLPDLLFAWQVVKYVKSNAIVYAQGGRTIGIGAGQAQPRHERADRRTSRPAKPSAR